MDLIHKSDDCICCSCVHFDRVKSRTDKIPMGLECIRIPCVPQQFFVMFEELPTRPDGYFYSDLIFRIEKVFIPRFMPTPKSILIHDCDKRSVAECYAYERKE